MMRLIWLGLGGALGTVARYGLNGLISHHQTRRLGVTALFPLGTVAVNVSGCFLIGILAALSGPALGRAWLKSEWRDFLMLGFCGGYTTFSSFSLQTLSLARDGQWSLVVVNVLGTNLLCLLAVWLGWVTGRWAQASFHGGTP